MQQRCAVSPYKESVRHRRLMRSWQKVRTNPRRTCSERSVARVYGEVVARASHYIKTHGRGTSLSFGYLCTGVWLGALTAVQCLALPCRNLAHNMLAAIYKHDFKPDGTPSQGSRATPASGPIYRTTSVFMTDTRCFLRGLSDIFVNARVFAAFLPGMLTRPLTYAGTMFVPVFD